MNIKPPVYDSSHFRISEVDAEKRFNLSKAKLRWFAKEKDSQLGIIDSKKYKDLCWWNGEYWVYITSNKK